MAPGAADAEAGAAGGAAGGFGEEAALLAGSWRWGLWSPSDAAWYGAASELWPAAAAAPEREAPTIPLKIHQAEAALALPRLAEAYGAAESPAEKSDILRLGIVLQHGGLYVDVDFECLHRGRGLAWNQHQSGNMKRGIWRAVAAARAEWSKVPLGNEAEFFEREEGVLELLVGVARLLLRFRQLPRGRLHWCLYVAADRRKQEGPHRPEDEVTWEERIDALSAVLLGRSPCSRRKPRRGTQTPTRWSSTSRGTRRAHRAARGPAGAARLQLPGRGAAAPHRRRAPRVGAGGPGEV
ncbi:unnamed protein product [Prorocentrum cordatum]|uniref:Uncharacterized protein n=1 Tax=Prorocentrum cordatum TaxID=2364126 RepID=A0ABN9SXD5_9DINO|nr:unnamed protein product [Polarella glacialis]